VHPPVIAIAGPAGSGKDTLAKFLLARFGGYRYSFADPLRAMLRAGFGIDMDDPNWQARKEDVIEVLGKSPRQLLQTLGTEWGRTHVREDVWLVLAAARLRQQGYGMVIADLRFENEAAWVRQRGQLIHITRPGLKPVAEHVSNTPITHAPGDMHVENNSTLEALLNLARALPLDRYGQKT